ncbi:Uncharacterised protein [Streptococcus pneumoniae]|nr:Uncharacterised protein [Streptococcus pneumoniae]
MVFRFGVNNWGSSILNGFGYIVRLEKKNGSNFKLTKNALKSVFQSIFCSFCK